MDLLEQENYWGGIISDTVHILKRDTVRMNKLKPENVIAYLFTEEQVRQVLKALKGITINVWQEDGVFCLSRYKREEIYCM